MIYIFANLKLKNITKMKKLILSFLGIAAIAATTLTSCKKDSDEATPDASTPTITIITPSGGNASVGLNQDVVVSLKFDAATDQKLAKITRTSDQSGSTARSWDLNSNPTTYTFLDTIPGEDVAGTYKYTYTIADKNNNTNSTTISIVVAGASGGELNSYSTVIFGAQSNATLGSFYDATKNIVYKQADAKTHSADVDFAYYYGANNHATIAAPINSDAKSIFNNANTGIQTWSTQNATQIAESGISASAFDALTADTDIVSDAAKLSSSTTAMTNLSVNSVLVFKAHNGKYGVAKVIAVDQNNTGSITISVKIQK